MIAASRRRRSQKKYSKRPPFRVRRGLCCCNTLTGKEAFRVNTTTHRKLARRKARIQKRLRARRWKDRARPMLTARNIRYEVADRTRLP